MSGIRTLAAGAGAAFAPWPGHASDGGKATRPARESGALGQVSGADGLASGAGTLSQSTPNVAGGASPHRGRTLRVGRSPGAFPTISEAAGSARDDDLVLIEAGDYVADVAVWLQRRLAIRAARGPVRLIARGRAAEDKAIWVLRDGDFEVSGIEFSGCRAPHRNGAGIRFERGALRVTGCKFSDNDTGLMTGNDPSSSLEVRNCEFSTNGANDGYSHNLYVGRIDRLTVVASYFARARAGHLLKSRARVSRVLYSRLTDESGGTASYEVDLPDGGLALLMGNLIVQEATTQNSVIVSFGAEGYRWPRNELVAVHNTIVNRRAGDALFVRVAAGASQATLRNNLFVGSGRLDGVEEEAAYGNARANERAFRAPDRYDFAPAAGDAGLRARAVAAAPIAGLSLVPDAQYRHPARLESLGGRSPALPGAFQD